MRRLFLCIMFILSDNIYIITDSRISIIPPTGTDDRKLSFDARYLPRNVPAAMAAVPKSSEQRNIIVGEMPAMPALMPIKTESADRAMPITTASATEMLFELSESEIKGLFITSV